MKTYVNAASIATVFFMGLMMIPSVNAEEIGMVTGSTTGTYIRFGKDIARVAKKEGLDILVKPSAGSLNNILRLDSKENAAFAIVQSDVLRFLKDNKDPAMQRTAQRLRLIFPFYNEEVHLFARKDIRRFEDLNGKRVVIGADGSGNFITATNLIHNIMNVRPEIEYTNLDPPDAVQAVLQDKADAMFYVAGKPVKLFKNLEELQGDPVYADLVESVHFVPLNAPEMLDVYVPSDIGPKEYKWVERTIPTVAVKAVLISFNFAARSTPYYQRRCEQLGLLGKAIRENINELRATGHPKWKEVDLEKISGSWELDECSRETTYSLPAETPLRTQEYQEKLKCTILGKCWRFGECVPCP